jgi:hypothetical protein
VAYWKFDEGSGAAAADSSGNGNHGNSYNNTWAAGRIGTGLVFNGTSSFVSVSESSSLSPESAVTVAAWVRGDSWSDPDRKAVLIKGDSYYLTVAPNGKVEVYAYGKSPSGYHSSNATLTLNEWHHIAMTVDSAGFKI